MNEEITDTDNAGYTAELLKEEYYRQADTIIKRAKANRRPLSPDDLKQLRELQKAIKELNGMAGLPGAVVVDPCKRIREAADEACRLWAAKEAEEAISLNHD